MGHEGVGGAIVDIIIVIVDSGGNLRGIAPIIS